ncbi:MAG TPA: RNA methyltransferase, partial [Candidatus Cloacimonadota bacterium]|nr:RNA methyltransferase [Candidatus Cloacimonadota bacterium]
MAELYLGLLHYPVTNKHGERVLTSFTNLDLHDISRLAATYGCAGFYVIHPDSHQQDLIRRICRHWETNDGLIYNPDRQEALSKLRLADNLDDT